MTQKNYSGTSRYKIPENENDKSVTITTKQFQYNDAEKTFYSDAKSLFLLPGEFLGFFTMRGKSLSHCFIYDKKELSPDHEIIDCYLSVDSEYKARITRLPIDNNSDV